MLVKDSEKVAAHQEMGAAEAARAQLLAWVQNQVKDSVYVRDNDTSPTNAERQLGRPLATVEVEKRLLELAPALRFEFHPFDKTKKIMFRTLPNGDAVKMMVYENGIIPEHSIMQAVIKETLNEDVVRDKFHINRKDLSKHEVKPHEFNADGTLKKLGTVEWDDTEPMVGMERTKIPWAERVRGYRTMLAILVHAQVITPVQAEAKFGSVDRPEWAAHMGRREKTTPW